ncbi:MAG: RecX family transcriptional regulator [Bacteroidales bacterium]|jgi:regulatory protein|nr:RecX family transcriptional regulator [Bacteroidales bacterium]
MMTENPLLKEILQKTCKYCSRGEKSEFEVRNYIQKNFDIPNEDTTFVIKELVSQDFINPERYVKAFINDKLKFNKWGKIKIISELKTKNIDKKIIAKYIDQIDQSEYLSILQQLLKNKKKQLAGKDEYLQKASLIRFGLSRGFEYDDIKKVFNE